MLNGSRRTRPVSSRPRSIVVGALLRSVHHPPGHLRFSLDFGAVDRNDADPGRNLTNTPYRPPSSFQAAELRCHPCRTTMSASCNQRVMARRVLLWTARLTGTAAIVPLMLIAFGEPGT